jgi:hypothetical protein
VNATVSKASALALLALGAAGRECGADPITLSDFSGNEKVITYADWGFDLISGFGVTSTFANLGQVPDVWGNKRHEDTPIFSDIPGASLGRSLFEQTGRTRIEITFPGVAEPVNRPGLLLDSGRGADWLLTVYDEDASTTERALESMGLVRTVTGEGLSASFERAESITRPNTGWLKGVRRIDDARFEAGPKLAALTLVVIALVCAGLVARKLSRPPRRRATR